MAIRLLTHLSATTTTGNAFTSAALNTTGADFLVLTMANYKVANAETITDSLSNTWVALTARVTLFQGRIQIFYVANATVGAAQTFSTSEATAYGSLTVMAFTGVASSPLDQQNTNYSDAAGQTSLTTGSITPTQDGELIIVGYNHSTPGTAAPVIANASLVGLANAVSSVAGVNFAQGGGYGIQGTAGAINITLTLPSVLAPAAAIASFKAA